MLALGTIEEKDFAQQLQELKTLRLHLESELWSAKADLRALSKGPDLSGPIAKLNLSSDSVPFEKRWALIKDLVSKIVITNDAEITIVLEGGIEWTV